MKPKAKKRCMRIKHARKGHKSTFRSHVYLQGRY